MRKLLKIGGWYLAYELGSTALFLGVAFASGLRFPGLD